uniref:ABC transporter I family member 11, chloroplastic n=1 Tax=Anthurium amnicola TaxID=1678845 RepID=A0A1D1XY27_9ARAE
MRAASAPPSAAKVRMGFSPSPKQRHLLRFPIHGVIRRKSPAGTALRVSAEHSCLQVRSVSYCPPGTEHNLLNGVTFSLPEKSFGLIFGQSGSGKTTLLHLLAGLSKPTSGSICIQSYGHDGKPIQPPKLLSPERVGIVFQFPERYFLADTILEEVTFGWPRQRADPALREKLSTGLQTAINSVGLNTISLDEDPHALSGGFKRRLALAIQLVQTPELLLLDEPLAGLDWKARAGIVKLLKRLKNEVTLLVVSHDLKELSSLVDLSWRMEMGVLKEEPLPIWHR